MASVGKIKVDVRGLKEARLLVQELTELEKALAAAKQYDFAIRVNHALRRFTRITHEDGRE